MSSKYKKLRVVARSPDRAPWAYGKDVEIVLVRPDGTEERLPNIKSVTLKVSDRHSPVIATIEAFVDADMEAQVDE